MTSRARLVLLIAQWIGLAVASTAALAAEPIPTVSLPPAAGRGVAFDTTAVDLASAGYTEQEFFISGNARAYVNSGTFGDDGIWNVSPGATAPYVTRMLVRTPTDPEKFNGTVVVEWLNVSGGVDAAPEWDYAHVELLREGYAWVGVTAQFAGAAFLHIYDSVRYASIFHPGDSWSYDIYSQTGMAILHGNPQPLGALTQRVHSLIAEGESQSASRMFTYYNAIQPVAQVTRAFSSTAPDPARNYLNCWLPSESWVAHPYRRLPAFPRRLISPFQRLPLSAMTCANRCCSSIPRPMCRSSERASASTTSPIPTRSECGKSPGPRMPTPICSNGRLPMRRNPAWQPLPSTVAIRRSIIGPETFGIRAATRALALWTRDPQIRPASAPRLSVQIVTFPRACGSD